MQSCMKLDVYEKDVQLPKQEWTYSNTPTFKFSVTDTLSLYNIFIVLRHTDSYKYNNIWVKFGIQPPGDAIHYQNIDITLGSDAKGWEGRGMDDIFEYRKNITPGPIAFKRPGEYTFTLSHIMREDPLKHVITVGVRVEKVNPH